MPEPSPGMPPHASANRGVPLHANGGARPDLNGGTPANGAPHRAANGAPHAAANGAPQGATNGAPGGARAHEGLGALRSISIHHGAAALDALERIALEPAAAGALAHELAAAGIEAVALSTCGRTELYWISRCSGADEHAAAALRARASGPLALPPPLAGEPVARHLFRVACGLESAMLGETEILGQLRDALERSGARDVLAGVFHAALRCGGRARAETGIGAGALSVASAAVRLLAARGPLAGQSVLVVGAGETGLKAARHLRAEGVGRLVVVNRTGARAAAAAAAVEGEAATLDELPARLAACDAAVVAAHAPGALVTVTMVREALAARPARPLALVDISLPRAVEPGAGALPGVTLHDLDGLEQAVRASHDRRRGEVPRVEELVEHELRWLHVWSHQQMIRPLFAEMRRRVEVIRREELERARGEGAADLETLDRITNRLVDRLLSVPAALLRNGSVALDHDHLRALRELLATDPALSVGRVPRDAS